MPWIARAALILLASLIFCGSGLANPDRKGCKDYPAISRMPNFFIAECREREYDAGVFLVGAPGKEVRQSQEGHYVYLKYFLNKGATATGMLQVIRNFQNAARASGGEIVNDHPGSNYYSTTLKLNLSGKEVWVLVEARTTEHALTIIEKQAMKQDVAINAAAMNSALGETGKVALYGIYFDTAKASLKPDSDPTLAEIAKLLKQNPALKVFIVGHTDMVGEEGANVRLSQARAQSVIAALTGKYGVAPARLKAFGAGPYAPVASNRSEEGRAKNRRVELVEIATQ